MTALMQNMPDSVRESVFGRAYRRIIRFPHTSGARLDSIVKNKERLIYYYTQDVNTEESGKRLNVTLRGRVQGLDGEQLRTAGLGYDRIYDLFDADIRRYDHPVYG